MGVRISAAQNAKLVYELTFEEFEIAVKQMHLDKVSGPDGLNPAFFQHWSTWEGCVYVL